MATKHILKKVRQQAVVKFVGTGSANIDMNDLALADETFDAGNCSVTINTILYNSSNATTPVTIVRGANTVFQLFGNDNWFFSESHGFVDNENPSANIAVTIPAPGGTVILGLTKRVGFTPPDQQTLKDYEK